MSLGDTPGYGSQPGYDSQQGYFGAAPFGADSQYSQQSFSQDSAAQYGFSAASQDDNFRCPLGGTQGGFAYETQPGHDSQVYGSQPQSQSQQTQ